jgi:hypothetical protein
MLDLFIRFIVVLCELYIVFVVLGFFLGLFNVGWRSSPWYPFGPNLPGNIGGLIVAIAVVIVFGHHGNGFG